MASKVERTDDGRPAYFPALDGIRAVCVLLVMYNHLKTPWAKTNIVNGHLGVDFFFLLSGFLITSLLLREQAATGRLDLKAFYWRRFFRIVPVYLVVLALYVAVCHLPGQALHWAEMKRGMPFFLTMNNEYAGMSGVGNTFRHTWSLGVEEKFYLLWPLLFFVIARTNRMRVAVTVGVLAAIVAIRLTGDKQIANGYFGLLAGSWLAVALSSRFAGRILASVERLSPAVVLACFATGFALASLQSDLVVFFTAGAALLMVYVMARQSLLSRCLAARPMVWLGRRSYSMYLVHILCLNAIEVRVRMDRPLPATFALVAGYALAAVLGAILYRAVEQPCRNFGRRWLATT